MSSQGVAAQIVRVRDARIRHCHCATKEATVELRQQNFPKLKSQNFGLSYRLKNNFIVFVLTKKFTILGEEVLY